MEIFEAIVATGVTECSDFTCRRKLTSGDYFICPRGKKPVCLSCFAYHVDSFSDHDKQSINKICPFCTITRGGGKLRATKPKPKITYKGI